MLTRSAGFAVRRRRLVLVLAAAFLALAGAVGGGVAKELSGSGFRDPAAPSSRAAAELTAAFGGGPNVALVLRSPTDIGQPATAAAATALVRRLAQEPDVAQVRSWWTSGHPASLRSRDRREGLVLARIVGPDDFTVHRVRALNASYTGTFGPVRARVGGQAETFREVGGTIERDVLRAEAIAVPVTAVLLVLVFGSAVAAALPLLVGVLSILGTFLVLHLLVRVTPVSVYAVNLATSMGLGLGIDYSLFLVTRYREELDRGRPTAEAIREAVRTAGRTVCFSALTVLLSLSAMLVFPLFFLRSFGFAGISSVLFATVGAIFVLPATLAALGPRIDRLDLRAPVRRLLRLGPPRPLSGESEFWARTARRVMRRPLPLAVAVVVLLLVAGLPFLQVAFSLPDDRVLPRSAQAQQVGHALRSDFPGRDAFSVTVVAPRTPDTPQLPHLIGQYATTLSRMPAVARVDAVTGSYASGRRVTPPGPASLRFLSPPATYLLVVPGVDAHGPAGEQLVRQVRGVRAPFNVMVGGVAAELVDTKHSLGSRLPVALGWIVLATFAVLFLFTGSVVVPAKALVLNLLSLSATFGLMVWVFQEGHLGFLVGHPVVTGTMDTTVPILTFCVLFGLSMDYEVFLLSRIKEDYDATGDNTAAVARGLARTGRLVTSAAGLLALVFLAFVSSDISFIKLLGLGTAVAVLIDATVVRGVLVPTFMRLLGRRNWWAPPALRRVHARFGLTEAADPAGTSG